MQDTDDQLRAPAKSRAAEAPRKDAVAVGMTANGEYAIIREIGKGGMGMVYEAKDLSLARRVAVKVINFPTNDTEKRQGVIERFRREAVAAAKVSHPNVIVIHAFREIGGEHVQVMEFIDGRTLRDELQAQPEKALRPERAARIVIELLKGVAALHAAGLCHRDLKPANVMLTRDGDRVKILDLGLVKFAEGEDPATDMTLTQCGVPMGSPLYMAPEQINALPDAKSIDLRTDLYAVGVILFQLLTGKPPFDGRKAPLFDQHRFDDVPKMVSPHGELSPALQVIVEKAMAKKSSDRFQSADKMREAIERLLRPPPPKRGSLATLVPMLIGMIAITIGALYLRYGHLAGFRAPTVKPRTSEFAEAPRQEPAPPPVRQPVIKDTSKIAVPPPVEEVAPTTKAGCEAYKGGRTSEAETILAKVIAKSPGDVEALYCLCGTHARTAGLASGEREACESFLNRASQGDDRKKQARIWLKRGSR